MICATLFTMQLFLGSYTQILDARDARMEAAVGLLEGKNEDVYLALLATTDNLTATLALAKGYSSTDLQCEIDGKPARVFRQIKKSVRT